MTSFREISREELEQEFSPEEIEDSEQVRPFVFDSLSWVSSINDGLRGGVKDFVTTVLRP